jgi:Ca-activated chloride channel family protein
MKNNTSFLIIGSLLVVIFAIGFIVYQTNESPAAVPTSIVAVEVAATPAPINGPLSSDIPCVESVVTAPATAQANQPARVDVMFVLDITSSMSPSIEGVKNSIKAFVSEFRQYKIDPRMGLIGFRDRTAGEEPQMLMFNDQVFTSDPDCFRDALTKLRADGGGDEPESDLDALVLASKQPFRSDASRKVIILITDASPKIPDLETKSLEEASLAIRKNKITFLYVICNDKDKPVYLNLREMTGISGGLLSLTDAATGKIDFERVLPEIARNVAKY